jgi:hypothetical protein
MERGQKNCVDVALRHGIVRKHRKGTIAMREPLPSSMRMDGYFAEQLECTVRLAAVRS